MNAPTDDKPSLIQTLVDEASDLDLVCYLVHSGGVTVLQDLLECIRDADDLSIGDLHYNIAVVRQMKSRASASPMHRIFRRLMKHEPLPVAEAMPPPNDEAVGARLH